MEKRKVFSTLTALTVGTLAVSGLVMKPSVAFADSHDGTHTSAGEKSCSHKDNGHGDKSCAACKDGKDKDGKACSDEHAKGEKSCSGSGEKSCGAK